MEAMLHVLKLQSGLRPIFDFCGDRFNYSDGMFDGAFPEGLKVTVTDGTFVAFSLRFHYDR
jgi:hypothetical protein